MKMGFSRMSLFLPPSPRGQLFLLFLGHVGPLGFEIEHGFENGRLVFERPNRGFENVDLPALH